MMERVATLKQVYVDPYSGEPLRYDRDHLVGSTTSYNVINNIPRFVQDAGITENWSYQWKRWRKLHLGAHRGAQCITDKIGFNPTDPQMEGIKVLDAGCGSGRNLMVFMNTPHLVWGVDMSEAVDVARENANATNIEIAQADLNFSSV